MLTSADNKQVAEGKAESNTTALQPSTTQSSELDRFSNEINSVNQPRALRATSLPSFHPSMNTIANDEVRSLRLMFQRLCLIQRRRNLVDQGSIPPPDFAPSFEPIPTYLPQPLPNRWL